MREEADLQHVWDVTRRSVEQFDKNISDIRKMCLTVTGIAVSATAYIISRPDQGNVQSTFMWLGTFIVGMAAVFWILDDHYHTYLKITAGVCSTLEDEMGLTKRNLGVSKELGNHRLALIEKYGILPRFITDIVYISIGLAALVALIVINLNAGELHGTILAWTSIDAAFFLIVAFVIFGWLPLGKMVKFVRKIVRKGFCIISACGRGP